MPDPAQKSVSDSNTVKLSRDCGGKTIDGARTFTETQGYTQMGTISTDIEGGLVTGSSLC
jgi:hypothetical protein